MGVLYVRMRVVIYKHYEFFKKIFLQLKVFTGEEDIHLTPELLLAAWGRYNDSRAGSNPTIYRLVRRRVACVERHQYIDGTKRIYTILI